MAKTWVPFKAVMSYCSIFILKEYRIVWLKCQLWFNNEKNACFWTKVIWVSNLEVRGGQEVKVATETLDDLAVHIVWRGRRKIRFWWICSLIVEISLPCRVLQQGKRVFIYLRDIKPQEGGNYSVDSQYPLLNSLITVNV